MRQKIARWLIVGMVALIPLCLLLHFGCSVLVSRGLMEELASIRSAGEPLSFEDLPFFAGEEIDAVDNAAGLIGSNGKDDGGAVETDDQDGRLDIGVRVRLR